jgi:hypothetical protein
VAGTIFGGVAKRIGSGILHDIGCAEAGRRLVDTKGAFEAKLRRPIGETSGRNMIAEGILRPGKLARPGVMSSWDSSTFWSPSSRG